MTDKNDASIRIRGSVTNNSDVGAGEIHANSSSSSTNDVSVVIDENVDSSKIRAGTIYQDANLVELKSEIKSLLDQLAQQPLTAKKGVATEAIKEELKIKPALKMRLLNAFKRGGIEALNQLFDHPIVSISIEAIQGFLEAS